MQFKQEDGRITLNQTAYLKSKVQEFTSQIMGKKGGSPLSSNYSELLAQAEVDPLEVTDFPYRQMVGSLMYAMVETRPDIALAVSIASRYLAAPRRGHCDIVTHIWAYVNANINLGISYVPTSPLILTGFVDASYATEPTAYPGYWPASKAKNDNPALHSLQLRGRFCRKRGHLAEATAL